MSSPLVVSVPTKERVIAFTFDDGPNPVYTPQVLQLFREAGGKATFFMIGNQIDANPSLAEQVHAEGHEIGNHTYTHPFLTRLSHEDARMELVRADERIRQITGEPVRVFRPPFFDANDEVYKLAEQLDYTSIGANNLGAKDWEMPGAEHIIEQSRKSASNGSIFIFHDGFGDRSQTVEAVGVLLRELSAEGYRFVTVSELLSLADREIDS